MPYGSAMPRTQDNEHGWIANAHPASQLLVILSLAGDRGLVQIFSVECQHGVRWQREIHGFIRFPFILAEIHGSGGFYRNFLGVCPDAGTSTSGSEGDGSDGESCGSADESPRVFASHLVSMENPRDVHYFLDRRDPDESKPHAEPHVVLGSELEEQFRRF